MKRILQILTLLFSLLTFIGSGYVLLHHGQVSAGYACVPCILCMACLAGANSIKNDKK